MLCYNPIDMKNSILRIFLLFFSVTISYAQVGIGTTNPSPASMLEVSGTTDGGSTYKGLMPPRVPTITDRNTINPTSADIGLLIFLQSTNCLQMWNGSTWEDVHCVTLAANSSIAFTMTTQSVSEGDGGISFDFTIVDPSPTNTIDVTITPADFNDIDEAAGTTITIPANVTTYTAPNVFTLTDDVLDESIETVDFTLSAPTGGSGTIMLGANTTQTLTIIDNDGTFSAVAQDFDANTSWGYSTDVAFFDNGADGFYGIDDGTLLTDITNATFSGNFLGLEDLNDEGNGTTGFATLTFNTINTTGATGIEISFDYDVFEFDTNDDIYYTVILDGVDQTEVFFVNGLSDFSTMGTETIAIPDGTSTVGFRIRFRQNGPDQLGFDNFTLN